VQDETDLRHGVGTTFRTTCWTVVLEAARADSPATPEAFGQLYRDYWYPLYAYLRRRGFSAEDGEDLAQDFFAHVLRKNALEDLVPGLGKFRSFLLRSLDNFLANEWDKVRAQKRGGGSKPLSLDCLLFEGQFACEPAAPGTPETLFELQWVLTLLARVMENLRAECESRGKGELFQALHSHMLNDAQALAYAAVAEQFAMTEGAVKVAAHRLRQRYGELLREEIGRTVSSPTEIDDELRHLVTVVGNGV
jgi:RNA polymerase sigma-70 factor (ECF subfamily)